MKPGQLRRRAHRNWPLLLLSFSILLQSRVRTQLAPTHHSQAGSAASLSEPGSHVAAGQQQHQQQHQRHNQEAAMNLIPVDQPVVGEGAGADQPQQQQQQQGPAEQQQAQELAGAPVEDSLSSQNILQPEEPAPAAYVDKALQASVADSLMQSQIKHPVVPQAQQAELQLANRTPLERRFGLFKKGSAGSGQYSSQYTAPFYLSDCDRCMASLSAGQQPSAPAQNADLQQLEPVPPAPTIPAVPVQAVPIISQAQPLGLASSALSGYPLKNKLFMKFPFFMKQETSAGPSYSLAADSLPYWHPHHAGQQPAPSVTHQHHLYGRPSAASGTSAGPAQLSGALFLRPAAYNCVQAPQLIAGGSPAELAAALRAPVKGAKQYQAPVQQASYSTGQY